jgi:hypothetical protein
VYWRRVSPSLAPPAFQGRLQFPDPAAIGAAAPVNRLEAALSNKSMT